MNFAILDDNPDDLQLVYSIIFEYLETNDIDGRIITFDNPLKISTCSNIDCFILDVLLPNANGVDLAFELLESNPLAKIIFASSTTEFSPPAHKIKPIGYLVKPVSKIELFSLLDDFMKLFDFHSIMIKDNKRYMRKIYTNDILTISPHDYKNNTHVRFRNNKEVIVRMNIRQWCEILDSKYFLHSYKNVLVNLRNIEYIKEKTIIFRDGTVVSCSNKYINVIEQKLFTNLDDLTWYR